MKVGILAGQRSVTNYAGLDTGDLYRRVGNNTGNLAFVTAIADQIASETYFFGWNASPEALAPIDIVVIPCANQFGAHTDLGWLADVLLAADKPVLAVGLGAQAASDEVSIMPTEGTLRWVRALEELCIGDAPNILVRGEYTQKQLAAHGIMSTDVIGCPSMFLSARPKLGQDLARRQPSSDPVRVATLAGNSSWEGMAGVDQLMLEVAAGSTQGLPWVIQEQPELIDLTRGRDVHPDTLARLTSHYAPRMPPAVFGAWVRANGAAFFDIEGWQEHMLRFDAVVGPRFHGAMLAMQIGTPAVVVGHDSRTQELCETMSVPLVSASDVVEQGIEAAWATLRQFDGAAFDQSRRRLAGRYVDSLRGHGIDIAHPLALLASEE